MQFEKNQTPKKVGFVVGYVLSYALFTTILFLILLLTHKLPSYWNVLHVIAVTIIIAGVGFFIRRLLR